jgi:hypothetical protein
MNHNFLWFAVVNMLQIIAGIVVVIVTAVSLYIWVTLLFKYRFCPHEVGCGFKVSPCEHVHIC